MTTHALPPTSELYPLKDLVARHPNLLSESRLKWALRNRKANGLQTAGIVFETRGGELVLHEPGFIAWWLGLSGRHSPRAPRRKRRQAA
jgi:hypothetical protein